VKVLRRFLICLILIFLARTLLGSYDEFVTKFAQKKLKDLQIPCLISSVRPVLPLSIEVDGLRCTVKASHQDFELSLRTLSLGVNWAGLLRLLPGIVITAEIPVTERARSSDRVTAIVNRDIFSGRSLIALSSDSLALKSFLTPSLTPGMKVDGDIEFSLSATLSSSLPDGFDGRGKLALTNGSVGASLSQGSLFKLPALSGVQGSADLTIERGNIVITPVSVRSNAGTLTGDIRADLIGRSSKAKGQIVLTESGRKTFGGFLALAARSDVSNPADEWEFQMSARDGKVMESKIHPR